MSVPKPMPSPATRPIASYLKIPLGLGGLVALIAGARLLGESLPQATLWIDGLGFWGPVAFVCLYALATILFVPGSILTLTGGAIFGLGEGVIYVFGAALLGSSLAFLVARYGARGWIEKRLDGFPRFSAIDRAVAQKGLKITFLLRLSPVVPFSLLNYALGLTRVSLRDYVMAAPGMLPGTFLYVYYGRVVGDVASLAAGTTPERDAAYYLFLGLGLAATLAVTTVVVRTAGRALKSATDADGIQTSSAGDGENSAS